MGAALNSPLDWIDEALAEKERSGLLRRLGPDEPELLSFAANDYLGLAGHPRVVRAAQQALAVFGSGARASRLLGGNRRIHEDLEAELAQFKGAEACLVFATGSAANLGLLPALAGPGDALFLDKACHATLYDGARLSGADLMRFPHNDLNRLEAQLGRSKARRKVVAVETLYSMDGDLAPLPEILKLAERYGALVVADEAHATGVLGTGGRGALEHFGLDWPPHLVISGTLSKALGSQGGFVAGPARLRQWLINSSRAFIFATGLAPSCAAAAREALAVLRDQPECLERLRWNARALRAGLERQGWSGMPQGPIFPLRVGGPEAALNLQQRLLKQGLYAPAIRPPTVPAAFCRLRISVSAAHEMAQIQCLLEALEDAQKT